MEQAWREALYGDAGFYRRQWPAEHFTTATHVGADVARAVALLARRSGLDTVVDVGAGGGELVGAVHRIDPSLRLVAVELRPRPDRLPEAVIWQPGLPDRLHGLVVGHELLDTVPCPVVELASGGLPRVVQVDTRTGAERLGPVVEPADRRWLERWWPTLRGPARRAEVGRTRDDAWAAVVDRLEQGLAVAVDYGHVGGARPVGGSLRAYAAGRRVPLGYDGSVDITADVALDAVAARVGGAVHRQRDLLPALARSPVPTGPDARLADLVAQGGHAEARAAGGLGELGWILTAVGVPVPCPA